MGKRGRPPYPDLLTPREQEVLSLLREGLSNPEIAQRLGISRDGAKYHVSEILTKLGVSSREEAARWRFEERRPWWAGAFAPIAPAWKKLSASFQGAAGVAPKAVAFGVLAVAVGGLALLAVLLYVQDGGEADVPAAQLSYLDADGALWLVESESGEQTLLAEEVACGEFPNLAWSPDGDVVACYDRSEGRIVLRDVDGELIADLQIPLRTGDLPGSIRFHWSPTGEHFLYLNELSGTFSMTIVDRSGNTVAELGDVQLDRISGWAHYGFPLWSPDGERLAYLADGENEARILTVESGEEESIGSYQPLAWASGNNTLIVGVNYEPPSQPLAFPSYDANMLDLDTGEITRMPELDDGEDFWLSPDRSRAAYLSGEWQANGFPISLVDLTTGMSREIADSSIGFPSHGMPKENIVFSTDGQNLYWLNVRPPGVSYLASLADLTAERLADIEGFLAPPSPDLTWIAYAARDADGETLFVSKPDGDSRRVIDTRSDTGRFPFAWRPVP